MGVLPFSLDEGKHFDKYELLYCCNDHDPKMWNEISFNNISGLIWRRQWHPTPVLLSGKSHRWRSLVGCSPWGHEELDTTGQLHFHFSLSCIGEGNGNPLHCSCLENPKDGGAWWAAVYGVSQSQTRLTWLSSSSRAGWYYCTWLNSLWWELI